MFLANKKIDNQVKTFITYNKGRDWSLLQAPDTDLRGNPVHCILVSTRGRTWGLITSQNNLFSTRYRKKERAAPLSMQYILWRECCMLKYIRLRLPGSIAIACAVI